VDCFRAFIFRHPDAEGRMTPERRLQAAMNWLRNNSKFGRR
jgi:hypothetical protein